MQTDHLISTRQPDLIIINKKKKRTCKIVDFAVSANHREKLKESGRRISTSTLLGIKKTVEHERDVYTKYDWCSWYNHQRINKGPREFGNKRTSGDYPVKDYQQTMIRNSHGVNNIIINNDDNNNIPQKTIEEFCLIH